jgi:cysteine-rich repeat protein
MLRWLLLVPVALGLLAGCLADFDDRPRADAGPPVDAAPLPDSGQTDAGPLCGNGEVDPGEVCDLGEANSDTTPDACRTNCRPARCGDGVTDTEEACDDGVGNSDTAPDACRLDCVLPECGDAVVDSGHGEECDDGNHSGGDGCTASCRIEDPVCGDGTRDGSEGCDDGNLVDGDGCSSVCLIESLPVLHSYASGATGWLSRTLTWAGDPHAPSTPVVAAAGMEPDAQALLFTTTTWHLLTLPGGSFTAHGALNVAFPGLPTSSLQTAVGQYDQGEARHTVMFLTGGMVYLYSYAGSPDSGASLELGPVDPSGQSDWQTPHAPPPAAVVADFMDLYNSHGWVGATIPDACGAGPDQQIGAYVAFLTPDAQLHLYEAGYCFEFFATVPLSTFGPFAAANAPLSGIAAMFYLEPGETFYVITQ